MLLAVLRANGSGSRNRKQIHHSGNDIIDADACGVDEDSIVCRLQGRHGTLGITGVAGHDLAQEVIKVNRNPLSFNCLCRRSARSSALAVRKTL
jgi:hypothetical protein